MKANELTGIFEEEPYRPEKHTVRVIDADGNVVDESEAYEGTSYLMMTAQEMLMQVKVGGKLEIIKHY